MQKVRGAGVVRWGPTDGHSPYVGGNGNWWQWDDRVNDYVDSGIKAIGTDGQTGPVPYPAGSWDSTKTYTRTLRSTPYVEYMSKYYLLIQDGDVMGGSDPDIATDVWEEIVNFSALYVDILLTRFAHLGSAIFVDDKLTSQYGILNGVASYDYRADGFIPNIMLNFYDGSGHLAAKNIEWDSSGVLSLGQLKMKQNGVIKLPTTWDSSYNGQITVNGIDLKYRDGYSQAQYIQWDLGLGYRAGLIQPNSSGKLVIESDYGLLLNDSNSVDVRIASSGLGGDIYIGNSMSNVRFNGANFVGAGIQNLNYGTASLSTASNYEIFSNSSLLVVTYITSGAGIYKIRRGSSGSPYNPTNGDKLYILNSSGTQLEIKVNGSVSGGNIKAFNHTDDYSIGSQGACALFIYYGGYWYAHMDAGQ